MDKIAKDLFNTPPLDAAIVLKNKFNDAGLHWGFFYKTFGNFLDAYYKSQKRVIDEVFGEATLNKQDDNLFSGQADELTEEIKEQVRTRDKHTCLCCGKTREVGKRIKLEVDHIRPVRMGGSNSISNLQTLCRQCNMVKSGDTIDFRVNITPLNKPKSDIKILAYASNDYIENSIARIANTFYHGRAMCALNYHQRKSGQFYSTWEIVLYSGNNPEWLQSYESELLEYINTQLAWKHVTKIAVRN
jgi:hypothetical protein